MTITTFLCVLSVITVTVHCTNNINGTSAPDTRCIHWRNIPHNCSCPNFQRALRCSSLHLNELEQLKSAIPRPTILETFALLGVRIPSLPIGLFEKLDVEKTSILFANMTYLLPPGTLNDSSYLDGLHSLKQFAMRGVNITNRPSETDWKRMFKNRQNTLERLMLYGSARVKFPFQILWQDFASNLSANLVSINISYTTLVHVESRALSCPNCKAIRLENNSISEIAADAFRGCAKLEILGLGWNNLRALPNGLFDGLGNLQQLDLTSNRLTQLSSNTLSAVSNTVILSLQFNPVICDCSLKELVRFESVVLNKCQSVEDGQLRSWREELHHCSD